MLAKEIGAPGRVRVTFSLPAALWADSIHVVGDFNGWSRTATPLQLAESGWHATVDLVTGRSYRYCFLIDGGQCIADCCADDWAIDDHGRRLSLVNARLPAAVDDAPPEAHERSVGLGR